MTRRLRVLAACALLGLALAVGGGPTFARAAETTPAVTLVRGTLLTIERGYLVFTTGDAVRLSPSFVVPRGPLLGRAVRVSIDPQARLVTAVQFDPGDAGPQEIDASALPRDLVAVEPGSAQKTPQLAAQGASRPVTVTLNVRVPDDTPASDDVYLSTDRT
ncbi:MAG: hypothetical protein ABI346_05650, partial [Candidatus Baltobacteraceae bacterium]